MLRKLLLFVVLVQITAALVVTVAQASHDALCPAGATVVHAGNGNWTASTSRVDECVQGGSSGQALNAGGDTAGACLPDQLFAEGGADTVTLGCPNDDAANPSHAQGNAGNDTVNGSSGPDDLHGDAGADTLLGNQGNDRLYDGGGVDVVKGGAGYDILCVASDGNIDENDSVGIEQWSFMGAECT